MDRSQDILLRGTLGGGQARAFVISSRNMVEEARRVHDTSPVCTAVLGRVISAAAIMGCQLKNDEDRLTLILDGKGPAGRVVATAARDATVKAMLENPQVALPVRADGKLDVGGAVGRDGMLTVVWDQGLKTPYTGKTPLVSGEVAEDLAMYYTTSEQTPSMVSLGVQVDPDGSVLSAGGVLVQVMPGCSESMIADLEMRAPVLADISRLMGEYGGEGLAEALFGELEWEILERMEPRWKCDCSRERIERALISLGAQELRTMIQEDHGAELTCHFCHASYRFDEKELRALLTEALAAP